ncbi:MAG: threonine/serine exporter family protein [Bacillota bacterium]|nr:MAG: hypothetical protein DIU55_02375 [Bacillota bacterium]
MGSGSATAALQVAAAAGVVLLQSGADVARVEDTVSRILRAYGVDEPEIYATPTGIFISVADEQTTVVRRVRTRTLALDRVSAVNALSRALAAEPKPPSEALRTIRAIAEQPPPFPRWLDVPASGLAAAAATVLVGGSLPGVLPAFLANLVVQAGERVCRWLGLPDAVTDLISGANAVFCATVLHRWLGVPVGPVVAGGIMILVPGIAFTNALRDAIAGDLVSATARGLEAFIKVTALAVGVGAALFLVGGDAVL